MKSPRHLFLTGFRGTGKSTVGQILANELEIPIVDLDEVIENGAEKTIREIFADGGETLFRDLESTALAKVIRMPPSVVSLGGGAILRENNRALIAQSGRCYWLDADAATIAARIRTDATTGDRRPSLTDLDELDEIRELLRVRHSLYRDAADIRIATEGKTPADVAEEVLTEWRSTL